jgi:plasmid stabilization system protein ParE
VALRVQVSKRAAEQVRRRADWWQINRPAAPGAVAEDFEEGVRLLAEHPGLGSLYEGSRVPGVRRLYLGRLKYFIYFKSDSGVLKVLAFWGAQRGRQPSL